MIVGSWMEFIESLLLPASSFGLVACFVRFRLLFLMVFLVSGGGRLRWPTLFFFEWDLDFACELNGGLNVGGATSCLSTVRREYLLVCFSTGSISR